MSEICVVIRWLSLDAPPGTAVPILATTQGRRPEIGAMAIQPH